MAGDFTPLRHHALSIFGHRKPKKLNNQYENGYLWTKCKPLVFGSLWTVCHQFMNYNGLQNWQNIIFTWHISWTSVNKIKNELYTVKRPNDFQTSANYEDVPLRILPGQLTRIPAPKGTDQFPGQSDSKSMSESPRNWSSWRRNQSYKKKLQNHLPGKPAGPLWPWSFLTLSKSRFWPEFGPCQSQSGVLGSQYFQKGIDFCSYFLKTSFFQTTSAKRTCSLVNEHKK